MLGKRTAGDRMAIEDTKIAVGRPVHCPLQSSRNRGRRDRPQSSVKPRAVRSRFKPRAVRSRFTRRRTAIFAVVLAVPSPAVRLPNNARVPRSSAPYRCRTLLLVPTASAGSLSASPSSLPPRGSWRPSFVGIRICCQNTITHQAVSLHFPAANVTLLREQAAAPDNFRVNRLRDA